MSIDVKEYEVSNNGIHKWTLHAGQHLSVFVFVKSIVDGNLLPLDRALTK